MVRLGSRYTVKGYLDAVVRQSLLTRVDMARQNLEGFVEGLPRNWSIYDFISAFTNGPGRFGWSFQQDEKRTPLGPRARLTVFLPCVVEIAHVPEDGTPAWSERALTAHAWDITVRPKKARMDLIPSSLYLSEHALRRIYERSGGVHFENFPHLIADFFDEAITKTDILLREGVFVKQSTGLYNIAVPVAGGLGVVDWMPMYAHTSSCDLGCLIKINGKNIIISESSYNVFKFWNENANKDNGEVVSVPSSLMRTFYAHEDLADYRRESLLFIELLLDGQKPAPFSPACLANAAKNSSGQRLVPSVSEMTPQAPAGLMSDALDSLDWMKTKECPVYLLSYGRAKLFFKILKSTTEL